MNAKEFTMKQIASQYNVPAKKGGRVKFDDKPGTIKGTHGPYLKIKLDGEPAVKNYHPTWKMEYLK